MENLKDKIKLNDTIYYYAQIIPSLCQYNILDMKVATLYDTYFACTEKRDKRRYLFNYTDIDKTVFTDRTKALEVVHKAEKYKQENISNERYYEED